MTGKPFIATALIWCVLGAGLGQDMQKLKQEKLLEIAETLRPLHKKPPLPSPHDWLSVHYEPGQTFLEYIRSNPVVATEQNHVIYIQPIGEFRQSQRKIIELTAEFLGYFYNLPVKIKKEIPLSVIPPFASRRHPSWGVEQILTTYVLDEILLPNLPEDAAAYLAFTTSDLWPGEGWNFVFGQASLQERIGVWSIYRNGDPHKSKKDFQLCLLRTLKTGAHEIGHMFSLAHCIEYHCLMNGSNHRLEADRRPLALCPQCLAKVLWATGADVIERFEKLAAFCRKKGLTTEANNYQQSLARLRDKK